MPIDEANRADDDQDSWTADSSDPFASDTALPEDFNLNVSPYPGANSGRIAKLQAERNAAFEYLGRQNEIHDAGEILESHREEFDSLWGDPERFDDFSQAVFAEDCFRPFYFTVADIQRVIDQTDFSPRREREEEITEEAFVSAILYLADSERRTDLAMGLLNLMVDFVAAERYLEGWLVQAMALLTLEEQEDSNPFLWAMFAYGCDAWSAERLAHDENQLKELGLDMGRISELSSGELHQVLSEVTSDPEKMKTLESFLERNFGQQEVTEFRRSLKEERSVDLLTREDTLFLNPAMEDTLPWADRINQHLNAVGLDSEEKFKQLSAQERTELFDVPMFEFLRDMADSVFTPDRIEQLVADLELYRLERINLGEHSVAELTVAAISDVKGEENPGDNMFLLELCRRSLRPV